MRDLIWTIIIVWLAWQFVNIFRKGGQRQAQASPIRQQPENGSESLNDRRKKFDTEGEYVDFEEVK